MSRSAHPQPSYDCVVNPKELRIGDAERESAMQVLGEHLGAGRLTVDEYGERSAQVATARTGGEIEEIFTDLPEPHPLLPGTQAATTPAAQPARTRSADVRRAPSGNAPVEPWPRPAAQRFAGALVAASWIVAIGLISVTHVGQLIFLPIVLSVVFGSLWGNGWNHRDRRGRRRDRY